MGLFSFFNSKSNSQSPRDEKLPEIPQELFIEKDKSVERGSSDTADTSKVGINLLFAFLGKNYELKGYDDALVNPDATHLDENLAGLKSDLDRTITMVKIYYDDFIRDIDVHLATRRRTGMVDIVEELSAKRLTAESHVKQIKEIEIQAKNGTGVGQGILLSYNRGFRNGLAAITHHSILKKNF